MYTHLLFMTNNIPIAQLQILKIKLSICKHQNSDCLLRFIFIEYVTRFCTTTWP